MPSRCCCGSSLLVLWCRTSRKTRAIVEATVTQARGMLVEAAFAASRAPGPLPAFYRRIKDRRGLQVAVVATARKMIVLCWHLVTKDQG